MNIWYCFVTVLSQSGLVHRNWYVKVPTERGTGMSFSVGRSCPHPLQTCCDTPSFFGKDMLMLSHVSCFGGGNVDGRIVVARSFGVLHPTGRSASTTFLNKFFGVHLPNKRCLLPSLFTEFLSRHSCYCSWAGFNWAIVLTALVIGGYNFCLV